MLRGSGWHWLGARSRKLYAGAAPAGLFAAVTLSGLTGLLAGAGEAAAGDQRFVLLFGQSNMVSNGGSLDGAPDEAHSGLPQVFIWKNGGAAFEPIKAGVNTVQRPQTKGLTARNFGPEVGFSLEHESAAGGQPLYIVKYAKGGSSLIEPLDWNPFADGPNLFTGMMDELRHARAKTAVGKGCIVVAQGEKDRRSRRLDDAYAPNFREILRQLRQEMGNVTAVWVRLTPRPDGRSADATDRFRAMQEDLAAEPSLNLKLVNADDLPKADQLHFDARGQIDLGRRLYRACFPEATRAEGRALSGRARDQRAFAR